MNMGSAPHRPVTGQIEAFKKSIDHYLRLAVQNRHRYLIVLSGAEDWSHTLIDNISESIQDKNILYVSDQPSPLSLSSVSIKGAKLKHHLGQECDHLIWNGFRGIHPDGLGAASGLVKGGGLLFLLIPSLDEFISTPDPDYARMCSSDDELSHCTTWFLHRLADQFKTDSNVLLIEEQAPFEFSIPVSNLPNSVLPNSPEKQGRTDEQQNVIDRIKKVATGRANRPLVISADRGRGKSTALGLASAELMAEQAFNIVITGPSEAACKTALEHANQANNTVDSVENCQALKLRFIPPDALLKHSDQRTVESIDLLLVDEAASIPAPLLTKLLRNYPRIVFSTTIHGYEGTGRGFAIRFMQQLSELKPNWKGIEMKEPIRWADNDPLEGFVFDALCLDAELFNSENANIEALSPESTHEWRFNWLKGDDLLADAGKLKQLFGLLVNAHYQTSPSDLRMLLDHPKLSIGAMTVKNTILAVVLLIEEGGLSDQGLAEGIIQGKRKPRNHLVPQALTFTNADARYLQWRTLRVMRIAVHPSFQRQGLGSALLGEVERYAHQEAIDYLSSSFGFTEDLMEFWVDNDYKLVRLGRHKDAASGSESVIVTKPINAETRLAFDTAKQTLAAYYEQGMSRHYREMDAEQLWALMCYIEFSSQKSLDERVIEAVSSGHRAIEDSLVEILALIQRYARVKNHNRLSLVQTQALTLGILQGRSWKTLVDLLALSGKAEAEKLVRESVACMIEVLRES